VSVEDVQRALAAAVHENNELRAEVKARDEDYRHLAANYQQLRDDINHLYGIYSSAAKFSVYDVSREIYAEFSNELRRAVDGPLRTSTTELENRP